VRKFRLGNGMGNLMQQWRDRLGGAGDVGLALAPLRLFLGFAFLYAGLSKIADRDFLDDDAPTSLHQTLVAVREGSPIDFMLGPIESNSALFGALIAIAEVAVGLGVLVGLLTRVAALGGMALAAGLWLTISWNADPWYTGADIVYVFALTPLAIAGAGALSADAWLASMAAGQRSDPDGQVGADGTRRALLAGALGLTGLVALGGAFLSRGPRTSAAVAGGRGTDGPAPASPSAPGTSPGGADPSSTAPSSAPSPEPSGPALVAAAAVPVGSATKVDDPSNGDETWVMQLRTGEFTAVRAACPHQGCAVNFVSPSDGFICPCHNSKFAADGARISGVATTGLQKVDVAVGGGQVRLA
jgi:thiosulfate dehydrogenase [quinone] large subunit